MKRLFMASNLRNPLIVNLAPGQNTGRRRDSQTPLSITLMPRAVVEMTKFLELPFDECKSILDRSSDVEKLIAKNALSVYEKESKKEYSESKKRKLENDKIERERLKLEHTLKLQQAEAARVAEAMRIADEEKAERERVKAELAAANIEITSESLQVSEDSNPDDDIKALVQSAMPSAKWKKEDLYQYAKDRGLAVDETTSKNMLLRKIRGVA